MTKRHLEDYAVRSLIDQALSKKVDSFIKELVLPQVDAVLTSPAVLSKVEARVKALLKDELEETDPYSYRRSGVEKLVDERIEKWINAAVQKELGRYLEISKSFGERSTELGIQDSLAQVAKKRVAAKLKELPAQLDAVIEEFMKLVATAKIPADHKRELHSELWGALVQVVVERFYGLLGKPAPSEED